MSLDRQKADRAIERWERLPQLFRLLQPPVIFALVLHLQDALKEAKINEDAILNLQSLVKAHNSTMDAQQRAISKLMSDNASLGRQVAHYKANCEQILAMNASADRSRRENDGLLVAIKDVLGFTEHDFMRATSQQHVRRMILDRVIEWRDERAPKGA